VVSDFFDGGWSLFIGGATLLSLLVCLVLLGIASRRKPMAEDNTTGHVWDEDLRELNNPLPLWWAWLFVITVLFALVYLWLYPGLGSAAGSLKWSSAGQYEAEQDKARAAMVPVYARYSASSVEVLARDAQAMGIGQRLFLNQCAGCHGSDARGSKGFPNLTLSGSARLAEGSPESIANTISNGRQGVMPPMAAAIGGGDNVRNVAHYVMSLSGSPHNPSYAQLGKPQFAVCAACHGPQGQGNQALGAPNLGDKVWLHGWGEAAISAIVTQGMTNVMPAQNRLLTPEQMHVLTAYVWRLSQPTAVATGR